MLLGHPLQCRFSDHGTGSEIDVKGEDSSLVFTRFLPEQCWVYLLTYLSSGFPWLITVAYVQPWYQISIDGLIQVFLCFALIHCKY